MNIKAGLILLTVSLFAPVVANPPSWQMEPNNALLAPIIPLVQTRTNNFGITLTPKAFGGSLTIAVGGAAQTIAAAGEVLNGCTLTNPPANTATVYVDFTGASASASSATSFPIAPGNSVACPGALATSVSIESPTTGIAISGEEW